MSSFTTQNYFIMANKLSWYALYTRPRHEFKVKDELMEMGFEVYLPLHKVLRQWSDRKKWITIPLIRSYCFVRIAPEKYLMPLKAESAVRYLYFDGKPALVRDHEIYTIRMICDSEYPVEVVDRNFVSGEKITISCGPLCGLEGEYIENAGKFKILVKINTINHGLLVSIPKAHILTC